MTDANSERVNVISAPGPNARSIIERDNLRMSPCMGRVYPLVIDHGKGAEVWDVDGNRYIDFMSGIAVTSTGHSHPEVVKAIQEQSEKFLHMCLSDFYYEIGVELAEKLSEISPVADPKVFFTNSGTESTEAALKLARYATGRPNFLAFFGGFHGRTMGSLSLTASKYKQRQKFYPLMPGVTHVPYPNPNHPRLEIGEHADIGEAVIHFIEDRIFQTTVAADSVAGIVVEPILGEGGYIIPPDSFLPGLRELCDRHGILLIADEVQSGVGRTGKWWGVDHVSVKPDIMTTAKGLASGLPIGAIIARSDLMTWGPGAHGSTFGGNPVAAAAAVKTLDLIEKGYMHNAEVMGAHILDTLEKMSAKHPLLANPRGRGLMIGVDIVSPINSLSDHVLRDRIVEEAFAEGLLILGAGQKALRFIPPLMIGVDLVDEALNILDRTLDDIAASLS